MDIFLQFIHLVFLGIVSLFPPVNPLGTALIVEPFLTRLNTNERKIASLKITFYCFMICASATILGGWLLKLFGISLPIVQIAGGILICRMGWGLLSSNDGASDSKENPESSAPDIHHKAEELLFYPIAFPMTTGAGTISVLLTLSAQAHISDPGVYLRNHLALLLSIVVICASIFFSYNYTHVLVKKMGPRGAQIVNRLSAFLVFCVGLQIASEGILHFLK